MKSLRLRTELNASLIFPLHRVEDRNDPMMQKMRRYIKAFSKEDEKEQEATEKTDAMKGSLSGNPKTRPKNRRSMGGWQMIRHSALGLDMEQEEPEEDQDIKYV